MKAFRGAHRGTLAFRLDQNCARAWQSRGQSAYGAKRARKLGLSNALSYIWHEHWISAIPIPSSVPPRRGIPPVTSAAVRGLAGASDMAAVDVRLQIYRPTVLACGKWYHLLHCGLSSSMCDFASSVPPADVARTLRIPGKTQTLLVLPSHACLCVRACVASQGLR